MADSEVRQKFEAWARLQGDSISRTSRYGEHRPYDSTFTEWEWRSWLAGFEAGMRAGEIVRSEFVIDLLGKRITRILEVGRAENDGEDYGQSHCFHLMEIQRILRGQPTCGVYDDYGRVPAAPEEKKS